MMEFDCLLAHIPSLIKESLHKIVIPTILGIKPIVNFINQLKWTHWQNLEYYNLTDFGITDPLIQDEGIENHNNEPKCI
jgi:hypothetical protein